MIDFPFPRGALGWHDTPTLPLNSTATVVKLGWLDMTDGKTIVVGSDVYDVLRKHGRMGETFDELVRRALRRAGWLK